MAVAAIPRELAGFGQLEADPTVVGVPRIRLIGLRGLWLQGFKR